MSSYHRDTHRSREKLVTDNGKGVSLRPTEDHVMSKYAQIIDHGDTKGHAFNEMYPTKGQVKMDENLYKTKPAQKKHREFENSLKKPKYEIHVNVNKARPEVQEIVNSDAEWISRDGNMTLNRNSMHKGKQEQEATTRGSSRGKRKRN